MVVNMLRAVHTILVSIHNSTDIKEGMGKLESARIMLNEIIKGLEGVPPIEVNDILPKSMGGQKKDVTPKPAPQFPTKTGKPVPEKEEPQYMISVGDDKKLRGIKGMSLEQEIIVDDKPMKLKDAIGKTFKKIKVVADE